MPISVFRSTSRSSLDAVPVIAASSGKCVRLCSSSTVTTTINIPKRKERGPTDILKSLASTVGRDPTAAHYKYHDDPHLIPFSNLSKRSFALAQESGRKAARWIVNEHPRLFQHKHAEPPIEIFAPRAVYDENSPVEEETLRRVIDDGQVNDAVVIYDLLESKGKEVSDETKQAFLELLCFYNCEESPQEDLIEERWFSQVRKEKEGDVIQKTWKDGKAESLFKSLKSPSAAAYSAIIEGMAKYGQSERAYQLYETACEKGLLLNTNAHNALITLSNTLKQTQEPRWEFAKSILSAMARAKLQPNVGTLNAMLAAISGMGGSGLVNYALSTLTELKKVGVVPSLGSYSLLLNIYTRERVSKSTARGLMLSILAEIEGKNFEIRHPADPTFFTRAMEFCRYAAHDIDAARRLDQVLHHGENYNLIGDSYSESVYYRHYFMLLCTTETIEKIMEVYNYIVPHVYVPEIAIAQEFLKVVDQSGEIGLMPQLWTDMVNFDLADREGILQQILDCLTRNEPAPGSPLVSQFGDIARQIWEKIESQPANRTNAARWNGDMLSNVLTLLTRADRPQEANEVLKKMKSEGSYIGEPKIEALCGYMDLCISRNDFYSALMVLQICKDAGFVEVVTMAKDLRTRLTLTDKQAQLLTDLVDT